MPIVIVVIVVSSLVGNFDTSSLYYTYCCERVIAHDIIEIRCALIMGQSIFMGAHFCNGISAEYWLNIEYFSNSKAGSSYSPKFDLHGSYNVILVLSGHPGNLFEKMSDLVRKIVIDAIVLLNIKYFIESLQSY